MKDHAIIWDLDGTLLDTLDDLTASANAALLAHGYAPRTRAEIRRFVGNGVKNLIFRALPPGDHPDFDAVFADFRAHYAAHCNDQTRPYPGILSMLELLHAQGIPMAVVSNKLDSAVRELCKLHFGGLIDVAVGECDGIRRKPAPDTVCRAMELLGVRRAVYVGDSEVDVATARNAALPCICVSWGFRTEAELRAAGAQVIVPDADRLMKCLKEELE